MNQDQFRSNVSRDVLDVFNEHGGDIYELFDLHD